MGQSLVVDRLIARGNMTRKNACSLIFILKTATGGSNTVPPIFTFFIKFPLCYSMLQIFIVVNCFLNVGSSTGYVQENDNNVDLKEIG